MKRFASVLPVLAAIILLQAGVEKRGSFDTEYADEQSPAEITQEVYKKGSFDLTAAAGDSGAGKGGDIPVTPG